MIWEALATDSLGRPVARAGRSTLPGASAQPRLLVNGTQTTVLSRLRFSGSPWTTRTGRRKPGPEPVGSGRFAQYTWPWATTIRRLQARVLPPLKWRDPGTCLPLRRLDSSLRSPLQDRDARCIRSRLPCKPGFATFSGDGTDARPQRKTYQELRSQFSYPKYNQRHDCAQTCKPTGNKPTGNVAFTIDLHIVRQIGVTRFRQVFWRKPTG